MIARPVIEKEKESTSERLRPKVFILILNWNQKDFTLDCLDSLENLTYPNYEIVLIDNASEDDSVAEIRKKFPSLTLIESESNLKVTGGRNLGIRYLSDRDFDYLLFLDNDTVVAPDILEFMVEAMEKDSAIAAATGKIFFYEPDDVIWCAGGRVDYYRFDIHLEGHGEKDKGQWDTERDVDTITGCFFMVRKTAVTALGGFDPIYVYGEDSEWCLRAKKAGFRIVYQPAARIWHRVSASWSGGNVGRIWGRIIFQLMRQYARPHHWIVFFFYSGFKLVRSFLTQPPRVVLSKIRGGIEGFFLRRRNR